MFYNVHFEAFFPAIFICMSLFSRFTPIFVISNETEDIILYLRGGTRASEQNSSSICKNVVHILTLQLLVLSLLDVNSADV